MPIFYDREKQTFHLKGKGVSYVMQILRDGYLCCTYWGKEIAGYRGSNPVQFAFRTYTPNPYPNDCNFSLDNIPLEYPSYGNSDFRTPVFQIEASDGSTITDLRYASHRIICGKPMPNGLPATYIEDENEADTLEICMKDSLTGLNVLLYYTVFRDYSVITRRVKFENCGEQNMRILRALSANVDFRDDEFEMLTLCGSHINERNVSRRPLSPGTQLVESVRGYSSHQYNPFMALLRPGTNEEYGEVYAMNLVYSGNFLAQVQVDQYHTARASIGINPFDFSWLLEPGESFETPEAVMAFSSHGLGGLSNTMHSLYRTRLCRGEYRDRVRPILINNWEATYFNFNADKIEKIAKAGHELGIELMVLDDGWFGHRDSDNSSLGDWVCDKRKLPEGLDDLAKKITATGMLFGLWFEPEMISPDSDLYRSHPDWCLHVNGRARTQARNQLVLDLSRSEVCDYIIDAVSKVLSSAPISYVKWDLNRPMTDIGSETLPPERQRETAHRYMLGLYRVLNEITSRFPHVLFESCAGGGGRFDAGMLYYMPQTWTSDNTDAVCRLKIQYGTSIAYPSSAVCSHVSAVPNHQVGRVTPFETRGLAAMSGNFGYELDPLKLTDEEKEHVKRQVTLYKELRPLVQTGTLYRLLNPFEGNESAVEYVAGDYSKAAVYYFRVLCQPNAPLRYLRIRGLDPSALYKNIETGSVYGGDELMNAGVAIPELNGDFASLLLRFEKV